MHFSPLAPYILREDIFQEALKKPYQINVLFSLSLF